MIVCKCIFGDPWTYRLTSKSCFKISRRYLAINSDDLRDRFNELVKLYRNPPKITGINPEQVKEILDKLLEGNLGAIDDHDEMRNTMILRKQVLDARRKRLESAQMEMDSGDEKEEVGMLREVVVVVPTAEPEQLDTSPPCFSITEPRFPLDSPFGSNAISCRHNRSIN